METRTAEVAAMAAQLGRSPLPAATKKRVAELLRRFATEGQGCTETIKVPDTNVRVIVFLSSRAPSYVRVTSV